MLWTLHRLRDFGTALRRSSLAFQMRHSDVFVYPDTPPSSACYIVQKYEDAISVAFFADDDCYSEICSLLRDVMIRENLRYHFSFSFSRMILERNEFVPKDEVVLAEFDVGRPWISDRGADFIFRVQRRGEGTH